jgi:hypothetical protein
MNITGLATGDYTANVTNEFGCTLSKIITVNRTVCFSFLMHTNNDGKTIV